MGYITEDYFTPTPAERAKVRQEMAANEGDCHYCGQLTDNAFDDDDPSVGYHGQVFVCHDCEEEAEAKENRARGYR